MERVDEQPHIDVSGNIENVSVQASETHPELSDFALDTFCVETFLKTHPPTQKLKDELSNLLASIEASIRSTAEQSSVHILTQCKETLRVEALESTDAEELKNKTERLEKLTQELEEATQRREGLLTELRGLIERRRVLKTAMSFV